MADLKTGYRELSGGGLATPLRQFTGRLQAYTPEVRATERGDRTFVKLDFVDVETIEATETYLFPVAQIELPYSDWRNTAWGTLLKSINDHIGPGFTLDDLVDKLARWYVELDKYMFTNREGVEVKRDCLLVMGLAEGIGEVAESAEMVALAALNGKTLKEFNEIAFNLPEVRADKAVFSAIVGSTWATDMVAQGKATVGEDGVHQVI